MDNDVASTLGFPMAKSNLALIEAGIAKAPVVRKTGTTIVAAVYKVRSTAGIDWIPHFRVNPISQAGVFLFRTGS
jgi:hypothetical protein